MQAKIRPPESTPPDDRARLRNMLLDCGNVIDCALDEEPVVATAMLIEVLDRIEEVLDTVAA